MAAGIVLLILSTVSTVAPAQESATTHDAIEISGFVREEMANAFEAALLEEEEKEAKAVIVLINSPGGEFHAGMRMADDLRKSPVISVCVVTGGAASIAFSILQACDWRVAAPTSLLHTHRPYTQFAKNSTLTISELEDELAILKDEALEISYGIAASSCWEQGAIDVRVAKGDWQMSAKKALDLNFIDEIMQVRK